MSWYSKVGKAGTDIDEQYWAVGDRPEPLRRYPSYSPSAPFVRRLFSLEVEGSLNASGRGWSESSHEKLRLELASYLSGVVWFGLRR